MSGDQTRDLENGEGTQGGLSFRELELKMLWRMGGF